MIVFVFGFVIPYIYNSLALIALDNIKNESQSQFIARWILYAFCSLSQIYFFMLEVPQLYYEKLQDYFRLFYNWFDISLPMFFIVHLALRIRYGKISDIGDLKVVDIFIEIAIYIALFMKTL